MSSFRFHHLLPVVVGSVALSGFGCGSSNQPPAAAGGRQGAEKVVEPPEAQTVTVSAIEQLGEPSAQLQAPVAAAPADTSDIEIAAAGMDADANDLRDVIVAVDEMVASALQLQRSLMTARTAGMAPLAEEIARLEAERAEAAAAAGAEPAKKDEPGGEETQADEDESAAQQEKDDEGEQGDEAEEPEADSASGEETEQEDPAEDDDAPDDEP